MSTRDILFVGPDKGEMNTELSRKKFNTFRLGTKYATDQTDKVALIYCPFLGNEDKSKRAPLGMADVIDVVTGPLDALLDAYADGNHALWGVDRDNKTAALREILANIYGKDKAGPSEIYSVVILSRI